MQVEIPEISIIIERLDRIEERLSILESKVFAYQEWYSLKEACARKGINYNSAKVRPYLQPNNGIEDTKINGKRMWHRTTIEKWLEEDDYKYAREGYRAFPEKRLRRVK